MKQLFDLAGATVVSVLIAVRWTHLPNRFSLRRRRSKLSYSSYSFISNSNSGTNTNTSSRRRLTPRRLNSSQGRNHSCRCQSLQFRSRRTS